MNKLLRLFHWLSFLQFPMILTAVYFFIQPIWYEGVDPLRSVSKGILLIGVAMSFASLAEVSTNSPVIEKLRDRKMTFMAILIILGVLILLVFIVALLGMIKNAEAEHDLWTSLLVLGIGMLGILRMMINLWPSR